MASQPAAVQQQGQPSPKVGAPSNQPPVVATPGLPAMPVQQQTMMGVPAEPVVAVPVAPAPKFDPMTGQPIAPPAATGGNRFDPMTGQPLPKFDPNTGKQNWW